MLEDSNVNVVDEFIQMIVTQRAYESNSKVVQAADQMLQDVNQHVPLVERATPCPQSLKAES